MADTGLQVGLKPKPLTFHYVKGYPLSFALTYRVAGVATAWPAIPQLFFGDPDSEDTLSLPATLTPSLETVPVEDSRAVWNITALEIDEVDELPDEAAAILVDGMPWWIGQAVRNG
jgi:hypothetical protein